MKIQIHKFNRRQRTYLIQSNLNRDRNDTQRNFSIAMQIQIQAKTNKYKQIQTNTNKYKQIQPNSASSKTMKLKQDFAVSVRA